jgi:hypothetical protein
VPQIHRSGEHFTFEFDAESVIVLRMTVGEVKAHMMCAIIEAQKFASNNLARIHHLLVLIMHLDKIYRETSFLPETCLMIFSPQRMAYIRELTRHP